MSETDSDRPHVDLIAWLFIVVAMLSVFFVLLDWKNLEEKYDVLIYAVELGFGVGAAALMGEDVRKSFTDIRGLPEVVIYGLLGGAALMTISQILGYIGAVGFSANSAGLALLAPVAEEMLFTYVTFGTLWLVAKNLKDFFWIRFILAAIPSSVVFALWHFWAYGTDGLSLIILTTGSLVLKYLFAKTESIGTPILAHLFNNFFAILATAMLWIGEYWWVIGVPGILIVLYIVLTGRRLE